MFINFTRYLLIFFSSLLFALLILKVGSSSFCLKHFLYNFSWCRLTLSVFVCSTILSLFLKNIFAEYGILCWQLSSSNTFLDIILLLTSYCCYQEYTVIVNSCSFEFKFFFYGCLSILFLDYFKVILTGQLQCCSTVSFVYFVSF